MLVNILCTRRVAVLQERLTQQQREMAEERTRLKEVIAKMDTQLAEQQRQLQQVGSLGKWDGGAMSELQICTLFIIMTSLLHCVITLIH